MVLFVAIKYLPEFNVIVALQRTPSTQPFEKQVLLLSKAAFSKSSACSTKIEPLNGPPEICSLQARGQHKTVPGECFHSRHGSFVSFIPAVYCETYNRKAGRASFLIAADACLFIQGCTIHDIPLLLIEILTGASHNNFLCCRPQRDF